MVPFPRISLTAPTNPSALGFVGAVREILGKGTILEGSQYVVHLFGQSFKPFTFMVEAPGAFVCLGLLLGIMNLLGD